MAHGSSGGGHIYPESRDQGLLLLPQSLVMHVSDDVLRFSLKDTFPNRCFHSRLVLSNDQDQTLAGFGPRNICIWASGGRKYASGRNEPSTPVRFNACSHARSSQFRSLPVYSSLARVICIVMLCYPAQAMTHALQYTHPNPHLYINRHLHPLPSFFLNNSFYPPPPSTA